MQDKYGMEPCPECGQPPSDLFTREKFCGCINPECKNYDRVRTIKDWNTVGTGGIVTAEAISGYEFFSALLRDRKGTPR